MNPELQINKPILRTWHIVALTLILLFIPFVFYLFTNSVLVMSVSNSSGEEIEYRLSSNDNRSIVFNSKSSTIRKFVKRGSYQITAKQNNTSGVVSIKTKGFLRTTNVKIDLSKEKARTFLGNQPNQCMIYKAVLISWNCYGESSDLIKHVPATDTLPTYTSNLVNKDSTSIIESLFSVGSNYFALTKQSSSHLVTPFDTNNNLNIGESFGLKDLSDSKEYNIINYKSGLLAYSLDGSELLFFENLRDAPIRINNPGSSDSRLKLYSVQVRGSSIALVYNQNRESETSGSSNISESGLISNEVIERYDEGVEVEEVNQDNKTELIVIEDSGTSKHLFNSTLMQVRLCGNSLVCTLGSGILDIYSLPKLNKELSFYNIKQMEVLDDSVLMVDNSGLIKINPGDGKGSYIYTFNGSSFCGLVVKNIIGLCVVGSGTKSLLSIEQEDLVYPVDVYVEEIANLNQVTSVSAYKNHIFISPDYGSLNRNPTTNRLEYSSEIKKTVNETISAKIKELGLDKSSYIIKQTLN